MTKIIQRHDTAANWTSVNPTLSQGEFGVEDDTGKFKIGDGQTAWNSLAYATSSGGTTPENMVTTDTAQEITGIKLFSNGLKVGGYAGISNNNGEQFIYVDPSHNGWTIGTQNSGGWFSDVHIKRGASGDYINIDSGNIGEYISGIEEQLVNKTDKVQAAQASMPSDKYIDLTLGASGSTYTAPANGYYYFEKGVGKTSLVYLQLKNITNGMCSEYASSGSSTNYAKVFLPVEKGDTVMVSYNVSGSTSVCRFIYAEGEV